MDGFLKGQEQEVWQGILNNLDPKELATSVSVGDLVPYVDHDIALRMLRKMGRKHLAQDND